MTLIVNITTPEGIVMASDSRQTQRSTSQMTRISTNNAYKLFAINNRILVGTAGLAFFADNTGVQKNVSKYVEDYCNSTNQKNLTVKEIATQLHAYLNKKYPWEQQLEMSAQQLKIDAQHNGAQVLSLEKVNDAIDFRIKQPNGRIEEGHLNAEPINLLVSGFNKNGLSETYELCIPGKVILKRKTNDFGCVWIGQGDLVARMIIGYDKKIMNTPIFQKVLATTPQDELIKQLRGVEYTIPWPLLTLQDAIDLAVFLIKSTEMIQRFADGTNMDNGEIQGVGGPIDVAVITQEDGIQWIKRKQIGFPEE
ncbi:hypothetical protein [Methanosphaera sp. WGK6]|uniref:hypothetical protein n=1 Tax=Methanosphaera sp. WGK6 TaxID=1561964 RepID=UPI00084C244D|nr:hypothetical protein [Methanosphaera sp. WGK6]OED30825.1 hypothetical protein NL43_00480 [Methanosphaera sp. WGK6]